MPMSHRLGFVSSIARGATGGVVLALAAACGSQPVNHGATGGAGHGGGTTSSATTTSTSSTGMTTSSTSTSTSTGTGGSGGGSGGAGSSSSSGASSSSSSGTGGAAQGSAAVTAPGDAIPYGGATATIGASGGTLVADFGRVTLVVPAGALAADTSITIAPITNTAPAGLGHAYRLSPDGLTFGVPASLTLALDDEDQHSTDIAVVSAATQTQAGTWSVQQVTSNAQQHTVTVSLPHFSDWSWFQRWHIMGDHGGVLFVGQTLSMQLFDTEPVDAGGGLFIPVTTPYTGSITATWSVVAGNGIIVDSNHTATYTQTAVPTANPALVSASLTIPNGPMITLLGRLHVLARKYQLGMSFTNDVDCAMVGGGTSTIAFQLATSGTVDFAIDDQFQASYVGASTPVPASVMGVASCTPQLESATLGPGSTPGIATSDISGGYDKSARKLGLALSGIWSDFPDYTMSTISPPSSMEHAAVVEPLAALGPMLYFDGRDGEARDYPNPKQNGMNDFKFTLTALQW